MDQFMPLNLSFNINKDKYKRLIKILRKQLPQSTNCGDLVVMRHSGPLNWLDVELIADDLSIILRLDSRTLYVRGYRRSCDTHFWEFYDDEFPLIPRSRSLGYSGSYAGGFSIAPAVPEHLSLDYHTLLGLTDTASIERENLVPGYNELRRAIIALAVMENPSLDRELSAKSLLVMIQMITEAARIELVGKHMVETWSNPKPIDLGLIELQNAWGTQYASAITRHPHARMLVSIEHLRLKSINSESPVELYGTVMMDCWLGKIVIYDRSSDNPESKGPGDYISLTGPSIFCADPVIIKVNLRDHDNEIANGDIVWDPRQIWMGPALPLSSHNFLRVKDVEGKCGSVSVAYAVLRMALDATVTVMVNDNGESLANVYGKIIAMIEGSPYQSWRTLFDKSEDEYVQVRCQEGFIPLTRPVFPAPVHSYITIQADLRDRDSLPPNNLIARGSVRFIPTTGTLPMKIIAGTCRGGVKVIINCD